MTIQILIQRLEAMRDELDPARSTPAEFEQVGWARRPLQELIDQAEGEFELLRTTQSRAQTATAVLAGAPLDETTALSLLRKSRARVSGRPEATSP